MRPAVKETCSSFSSEEVGMKKTLAIVAVALFAAAPAFAANTAAITYTLCVGGNNGGTTWTGDPNPPPVFDPAGMVAAPGTYVGATGQNVFTWSVRVAVSGSYGPDGLETPVYGAANLVWDLAVKDSLGNLVALSHGSPAAQGFYSNIQDGVKTYGGNVLTEENAAFPWVFDPFTLGTTHRIFDTTLDGGIGMLQYTYPNTAAFKAGSTAPTGTLKGMGAGYKDFASAAAQSLTGVVGGVGLTTGGSMCYQDIGLLPIAEGQINMGTLAAGTYTLELTPGKGNNALWYDMTLGTCDTGSTGAFAVAVPAGNITAPSMLFVKKTAAIAPVLLSSASGKTHGTCGVYNIPFIGESATNPGGATSVAIECRQNGVTKAVFTFDVTIAVADGTPTVGDEVKVVCTSAGGPVTLGTITPVIAGNVLTVNIANMPAAATGGSCLKITLHNIGSVASPTTVMADTCKNIKILRGDITGDGKVLSGDVSAAKAGFTPPAGGNINSNVNFFRRDVVPSGTMLSGDVSLVKSSGGDISALPCACP